MAKVSSLLRTEADVMEKMELEDQAYEEYPAAVGNLKNQVKREKQKAEAEKQRAEKALEKWLDCTPF